MVQFFVLWFCFAVRVSGLHVVVFGDSWTESCDFGVAVRELTRVLSESLRVHVDVKIAGWCGASSSAAMLDGWDAYDDDDDDDADAVSSSQSQREAVEREPRGLGASLRVLQARAVAGLAEPVDLVVIQSALGDLYGGVEEAEKSVVELHSSVHAMYNVSTIAVELPAAAHEEVDDEALSPRFCESSVEATREAVNGALLDFALANGDRVAMALWPSSSQKKLGLDVSRRVLVHERSLRILGASLADAATAQLRRSRCGPGRPLLRRLEFTVEVDDKKQKIFGDSPGQLATEVLARFGAGGVLAFLRSRTTTSSKQDEAVTNNWGGPGDSLSSQESLYGTLVGQIEEEAARHRDDEALCSVMRFHLRMDGVETILVGTDPDSMALTFVSGRDRNVPLRGAGCDDESCVVALVAAAIRADASTSEASVADFELSVATGPDASISAPLIVACSSASDTALESYEFKKLLLGLFGTTTVHKLFVRDRRREWYLRGVAGLGPTPQEAAAGIHRLVSTQGLTPRRTLVVGDSMGGFGALLLGALLRADEVVALVPQTYTNDSRWPDLERAGRKHGWPDLAPLWRDLETQGCPTRALIAYGQSPMDVDHATHLAQASACVTLDPHPINGRHEAFSRTLREQGALAPLLQSRLLSREKQGS